jgi:tetratricopeptide (TPR) repeat protein
MRSLGRAAVMWLLCAAGLAQQQPQNPPSFTDRPQFAASNPLVAEADKWYLRRQEGRAGIVASAGPINQAIAGYDKATADPHFVEARWKLMRALYFKGAYTGLDDDSRKAVFEKARRVGDDAIAILGSSLEERGIKGFIEFGPETLAKVFKDKTDANAAPTFYWAAACQGQWALAVGKLEAARKGAADKIRDFGLTVMGIDPQFEEGGGYRIVGRLNDQAPWIPFITGWVSREDALKYLRLALQVNGRNFANRHFLAEALHKGDAKEQAEALTLEEGIVADSPSPQRLVEELTMQEMARANLADWKKAS